MNTDRNLLFGVLALQADLIDADQLAEACSAWAAKKAVPLADLLCDRGSITADERTHVEFLVRRGLYPAGHPMIAAALMDFGRGLVRLARCDEADAALAESISIVARSPRALSAHYPAWSECWYGAGLAARHRYAEAEPHLLAVEKGLREARSTPRRYYREGVEQLVKLYEASGKSDQAAKWRRVGRTSRLCGAISG